MNKGYGILLGSETPMILDNGIEELKNIFSFKNAREFSFNNSYYFDGTKICTSMIESHRCIVLPENGIEDYYKVTFENGLVLECSSGVSLSECIGGGKYIDYFNEGSSVLLLKFDGKNTYIDKTTVKKIEKLPSLESDEEGEYSEVMYEVTSTENNILIPYLLEDNTLSFIMVQ